MAIVAFAEGPEPEERMGHTCTLVGRLLLIIGGKDCRNRYMTTIHILDTGYFPHFLFLVFPHLCIVSAVFFW